MRYYSREKKLFILVLIFVLPFLLFDNSKVFSESTDTSEQTDTADTVNYEELGKIPDETGHSDSAIDTITPLSSDTDSFFQKATHTSAGSFNRIIESVTADIFTGRASLAVPIDLPKGRGRIQPNIAINYNYTDSNTFIARGWDLSLGSIQRSTKDGVPKYNSTDKFVAFKGHSSDLVSIGGSQYRAKIESSFINYEFDAVKWQAYDTSGTQYSFGANASSRMNNSSGTFCWYLDRVSDIHGNYMTISYIVDQSQPYPKEILYTGNTNTGISPKYKIIFNWQDRTDTKTLYISGSKVVMAKRLESVEIYYQSQLISRYALNYEYSASTKTSILKYVQKYGSDNITEAPRINFSYRSNTGGWSEDSPKWHVPDGNFVKNSQDQGRRLYDINGDGMFDFIISRYDPDEVPSRQWLRETHLNSETGFSQSPNWWPPPYGYFTYNTWDDGRRLIDLTGDGKPELLAASLWDPYANGYYKKAYVFQGNKWVEDARWNLPNGYFVYGNKFDGGRRFADLNGDGLNDLIIAVDELRWSYRPLDVIARTTAAYINTGSGWARDDRWNSPDGYFVTGSGDQGRRLADVNGDGLADFLVASDSYKATYLNTGSGWARDDRWNIPDGSFAAGGKDQGRMLVDINGDGLVDLVIASAEYKAVYINTGSGWARNDTWNIPDGGFVDSSGKDQGRYMADLDGDGVIDICIAKDDYKKAYLNLSGVPDILVSVANGIGGTVGIEYMPSTSYDNYLPNKTGKLPFSIPVVSGLTYNDGQGNEFNTGYFYKDGCMDAASREFRGFGYVKVTDHEGHLSETWFKQDDIYKGKAYKQKITDVTGVLYMQTDIIWQNEYLYDGKVGFPYTSQSDSYSYDGGVTKHTRQSAQFTFSNNLIDSAVTIVEGDVDDLSDDKTSYTYFTHNTADWILSLPYETELKDANGTTISKQRIYYDSSSSLGDTPVKGLPTKQSVWLDLPSGKWISAITEYNSYGNVTKTTDPRGNSISTVYDSTLNQYPITITNQLNHTQTFTYDYSTGQILTSTDTNSQTTRNVYDSLGRLKEIYGPLDTDNIASVVYEYDLTSIPNRVTKKVKKEYNSSDYITTYSFSDGFGRVLESRSPAEPDGATSRQVISGVAKYNYQGKVVEEYKSYFEASSSSYSTPNYTGTKTSYTYDPLGRVETITAQNEEGLYIQASRLYSGWTVTSIDFKGNKKESYYDAFGKLIKITEYNNTSSYNTYYEYDALGDLEKVTDNQGNITTISYDSLGRKLSMSDPDMGVWSYAYDDNGNLISQTDAKGQIIYFTYDAINRLTQKQTPDAITTYTYDQGLNSIGRLSNVTYSGGATSFTYDELGREVETIKNINSTSYTIQRTYDALDRLKTLSYPDGEKLTYTYGVSGAVKKIEGLTKTYVEDIIYNAQGQMKQLTYGNGSITNYTYSPYTQRLANLLTTNSEFLDIQDISYTFDNVGNITEIDDAVNTATQSFVYDDINRLTQADNQAGYGTLNYAYNSIGNIMQKGTKYFNYGESGAGPHALTSSIDGQIICTYDANGNMVSKNDTTYEYDSENKLKRVERPSSNVHDTFNISLKAGWNFITLPVVPDGYSINDEIPISAALGSLTFGVDYAQVTKYDASIGKFKSYCDNLEYNQFDSVKYLQGYQVYALRNCTLTITGSSPSASYSMSLPAGYNLIGVDITNNGKAASSAFFNISYSKIKWYNPNTQTLEDISSGDTVEMGQAYYIECVSSSSYSVSGLENITTFTYDGDGGRVRKSVNGISTYYVGSLFEKKQSTSTRHIFLGSTRISSVTSTGTTSYYHGDHLGSSTDITDKNGALSQHTEYTPYGEFSATDSTFGDVTPYLYTGQLFDPSTELYYYGARYYDPQLGRFITADTIVPDPADSQGFNRYAYAKNNPIVYTDPTGHSWFSKVWKKITKFFKEKIFPCIITQIAVFTVAFIIGGPQLAFSAQTLVAATAATLATATLNTGEGRQLQKRVANEVFDDALGMSPGVAATFSSMTLHMAFTTGYNVALNAMIFNPNLQAATDKGQAKAGIEGRVEGTEKQVEGITRSNSKSLQESSSVEAPGKLNPEISGKGKSNYDFAANSGEKQVFDMKKSLSVGQSPSADKAQTAARQQWREWKKHIYDKIKETTRRNETPFDETLQMPALTRKGTLIYEQGWF